MGIGRLLAACGRFLGSASASRNHRRRIDVRFSDPVEMVGGLQGRDRHEGEIPVDRVRRRHHADQGRNSGLRRVRRAAQASRAAKSGLGQFPLVIGGIVPVVNIDGVKPGDLKFTGPLLPTSSLAK